MVIFFYKKWKKYNEIKLTKNKMNLNIRKMTNHPPSPASNSNWVIAYYYKYYSLIFDRQSFRKKQEKKTSVPFSMAILIGNEELMHECSPKHLSLETARMQLDKRRRGRRKEENSERLKRYVKQAQKNEFPTS